MTDYLNPSGTEPISLALRHFCKEHFFPKKQMLTSCRLAFAEWNLKVHSLLPSDTLRFSSSRSMSCIRSPLGIGTSHSQQSSGRTRQTPQLRTGGLLVDQPSSSRSGWCATRGFHILLTGIITTLPDLAVGLCGCV